MISKRIKQLRNKFNRFNIDGYIIPKNDEFFSEYAAINRLKIISNFSGSAGLAIILRKNNYLFVDGRYSIQAQQQSGKQFKIIEIHKFLPHKIIKNLILGFDPSLLTRKQLNAYFGNSLMLKQINKNLIDEIYKEKTSKTETFFSLNTKVAGETFKSKINKIRNILKSNKTDYLFVSSPENVAWVLNIRGSDNPNSPIPNCRLIIGKGKELFLIAQKEKTLKIIKEKKLSKKQIISPEKFEDLIKKLKGNKFIIDPLSCSVINENIIKSKFQIISIVDPCYKLKSIKNSSEIKHMINAHIEDGIALTKFIYWIKNINKKKITEIDSQNKLEKFRKLNKNYLFPSFNTIAGTGPNAALPHYIASKKSNKTINKNDIFLCDSGGQYKFGTTDVTRTICFSKQKNSIKDIFTKVLKGHIAVATTDLKKFNTGKKIDVRARQFLKKDGLDYAHGTGHGVGFFSNVHEGPQSITKINTVKLEKGMIVSNEPGYYKKGHYGIRIENLVYIKKINKKLYFKNLTLAPIEKNLINFKLLNNKEKKYLNEYHKKIYMTLNPYLNKAEKTWLKSFIS
ncbi:MAG TPA: aminopeptidase P family protein [Pelagibacteraceae bacterium]|jgi:Xaa-Pro aminopeptidase|nr:aminopeptidase P family protein [Pelagibacteraceae bacterium]